MKARDIREALQGNTDPKIVHALCSIAESASAQQQEIAALAQALDKLTDLLMQLGATVEVATNAVDDIKKIREN
jgi:hypothetical protein